MTKSKKKELQRKRELEKVKEIIKNNIEDYCCGIFNTRNIVGDYMHEIFNGKYFKLDGCHFYSYYELFGTTNEEWQGIKEYYDSIRGW